MLKNKSKLLFMVLIILCLFATQAVTAVDGDNSQNLTINENSDSISYVNEIDCGDGVEENANAASDVNLDNNDKLCSEDPEVLKDGEGTFSELQALIDNTPSGGVLELTKNYKFDPDVDNDYCLNIFDSISIYGNGFTIDGANQAEIFYVISDDVLLDGITCINAVNPYGVDGDAVEVHGSNCVINDCTFENNQNGAAGAVYWNGENGRLTNSVFKNNKATNGNGGAVIWNTPNGVIENNDFIENYSPYNGGALFVSASGCKISDSRFKKNQANSGGAVYIGADNCVIDFNSEFIDNTAKSEGGAVRLWGSNALIEDATFEGNTAAYGGALNVFGSNNEISYSVLNHNSANAYGGAVYTTGNNNKVSGSSFEDNHANYDGGAILWNGKEGEISNSKFLRNDARNGGSVCWNGNDGTISTCYLADSNAQNDGGAVYWKGKNGNIDHCTGKDGDYAGIYNNHAGNNGGAIFFASSSENSKVQDSRVAYNGADNNGGAIYWDSANGAVDNTEFEYNGATTDVAKKANGGAIYWNGNNALVNNSYFNGNYAWNDADFSSKGGAVLIAGNDSVVNNSEFNDNYADDNGGAITWMGSNGKLDKSDFYLNKARGMGGAVFWNGKDALINNSNFINNTVDYFTGGGVQFAAGGVIDNSKFINNTAHKGGGVFWYTNEGGVINNSYFENNYADYGGAGISCDYNYPNTNKTIANSEFVKNTAHDYGGAIASLDTNIVNSTFKNNKAHLGGAVHSYSSKISDSKFKDNTADYGNDLYYYTEPKLENTDVPTSEIEVVHGELVEINYGVDDIGNSTRRTNTTYVAMCVERHTYYPHLGSKDDTLRGLINIYTGESIADYLKILIYTYFNSKDDVYPHEGDHFVLYPEAWRDYDDRWEHAVEIPRPDYYSRAVHEFSDHDFWNSDHPVVLKVLELYKSGFRVPDNATKVVNGTVIKYKFSSMISPTAQSLFLFDMESFTSVNVTKVWNDSNNQDGLRPINVTVELYNDTGLVGSVVLNESNGWKGNFTDLPVYSNGAKVNYTVREVSVDGYAVSVTNATLGNYTITNTHVPEVTSVNVTKVWSDSDNMDGIRPASVTVVLFADGVKINEAVLNSSNGWKCSFNDLPVYKDGKSVKYTIGELDVAHYVSSVTNDTAYNFTVENTHEHIYVPNMTVQKITLTPVVKVGEIISFKIVVKNTGDCKLGDIFVYESNYDGLIYKSFKGDKWTKKGNKFYFKGILNPGESCEFTIFFKATKVGEFTNTIIAGSNGTKNETTNNKTKVIQNKTPDIPENKSNKTVHEKPPVKTDIMRPTGNPIVALLAVLFIACGSQIRKFKK